MICNCQEASAQTTNICTQGIPGSIGYTTLLAPPSTPPHPPYNPKSQTNVLASVQAEIQPTRAPELAETYREPPTIQNTDPPPDPRRITQARQRPQTAHVRPLEVSARPPRSIINALASTEAEIKSPRQTKYRPTPRPAQNRPCVTRLKQ